MDPEMIVDSKVNGGTGPNWFDYRIRKEVTTCPSQLKPALSYLNPITKMYQKQKHKVNDCYALASRTMTDTAVKPLMLHGPTGQSLFHRTRYDSNLLFKLRDESSTIY